MITPFGKQLRVHSGILLIDLEFLSHLSNTLNSVRAVTKCCFEFINIVLVIRGLLPI